MTHCTNCRQKGHFRSTCENKIFIKAPIQKKKGCPLKKNSTEETIKRRKRQQKQKDRNDAAANSSAPIGLNMN
ncbi:hypothetical protein PanWU01x14_199080 [Parasponia andersonii]|uniref:Uncharacterized protein n=1 Tax=Parasponia andersonii TaxID=3476 RepID=A0A2P5BYR4_PARAD|nr:hypothetical protein PanWU01x14_199080 [Parasponia andersonii]